MNNDSGYMKIIYVHCSEETNMKFSYIHNHYSSLGWFIWTQHNDQLPVGLLALLVERCTSTAENMDSKSRTGLNFFQV